MRFALCEGGENSWQLEGGNKRRGQGKLGDRLLAGD